jgi:hypothetical protein
MTVPTIDGVLARTHLGGNSHEWGADGGVIRVTRRRLRSALEDAYDPNMPDRPSMVELDQEAAR